MRVDLVMRRGVTGRRYILGNTNLTLEGLLAILSELLGQGAAITGALWDGDLVRVDFGTVGATG